MTFDDAHAVMLRELAERRLLMNPQILKLLGGDEALMADLRSTLIQEGYAIDKFGVGLSWANNPLAQTISRGEASTHHRVATNHKTHAAEPNGHGVAEPSDIEFREASEDFATDDHSGLEIDSLGPLPDLDRRIEQSFGHHSTAELENSPSLREDDVATDWWLMQGGTSKGPFSWSELLAMRQRGGLSNMDLVREGNRGLWQRPADVPVLCDIAVGESPQLKHSDAIALVRTGEFNRPVPLSSSPDKELTAQKPQQPALRATENRSVQKFNQTSASEDTSIDYFLWDAGHPVGPFTRLEIKKRLDDGRLSADEFVQVGHQGEWQPVSIAILATRPSLRIGLRSSSLSDTEINSLSDPSADEPPRNSSRTGNEHNRASDPSQGTNNLPQHSRGKTSVAIQSMPLSKTSGSKIEATRNRQRLQNEGASPIIKIWNLAADQVGGSSRLWSGIITSTLLMAFIVWWRQPPSASTIHREFAACYTKIASLRERRASKSEWSDSMRSEESRIPELVKILQVRAGASRPAEQQLLWAAQKGLISLLKNPQDHLEADELFKSHMAKAQSLIHPGQTPASLQTSSATRKGNASPTVPDASHSDANTNKQEE